MKRVWVGIPVIVLFSVFSFQQKPKIDLKASMERGKEIYLQQCITCHMEQGEGLSGVFPPLAKSDYMLADKKRAMQQILYGVSGEMTVNGIVYNNAMTGFDLGDEQLSDLMNYIYNSFGNTGGTITSADAKASRK